MDVSEEIKMLEEYKDALNVRLERVNKWLDGLRSGSTWIENEAPTFPITQQWGRAIISKYGALIDRDIHPHTFRHPFAINSVRHGVDIRRLQQVLGHSNITHGSLPEVQ
jgi:site-specific recombinase XerD